MSERASGSRRLPASAWVFDSAPALAAAAIGTAFFVSEPMATGLPRGTLALGYGLVLLHTLPLAARRRFPLPVLATSVAPPAGRRWRCCSPSRPWRRRPSWAWCCRASWPCCWAACWPSRAASRWPAPWPSGSPVPWPATRSATGSAAAGAAPAQLPPGAPGRPGPPAQVESLLLRGGGWALVVGRGTAGARVVLPGLAGMLGLRYRTFALWTGAAAIVWATADVLLGYLAGAGWRHIHHLTGRVGLALAGAVLVALTVAWLLRRPARRHDNPLREPVAAGRRGD